jgi:hypothetical protein
VINMVNTRAHPQKIIILEDQVTPVFLSHISSGWVKKSAPQVK